MNFKKLVKESFVVIGKEGSTKDGDSFIKKLWEEANANFNEVAHLAKKDDGGNILGIWGAMSDYSHSFRPWENGFTQGLYLAGVECNDGSEAPKGWSKWVIPSYEYLSVENNGTDTFRTVIDYLQQNHISLAGAVHEFNCPKEKKGYLLFPLKQL